MTELLKTPLYDLHVELGAKMVPFAGYAMPVQFPDGVLREHKHTREAAGLFDVSHMGQVTLSADSLEQVALALEAMIPADFVALAEGRQRYGVFTNETGGILDDLMVTNRGDHFLLVVNAACKAQDIAHMQANLPDAVALTELSDRALLALQGPTAEAALSALNPEAAALRFMSAAELDLGGTSCWVSRTGYSGEDGYEISVPGEAADALARTLLAQDGVAPVGLGARDSLRLEAGLCLYGNDIDAETSPVEAALTWSIQKSRRRGGAREGGFPGAARILAELENGPTRRRVGLKPQTRAPMRQGVALFADETAADAIGAITSGGFGPSVEGPVAMGYVSADLAGAGTALFGELRGKRLPVEVVPLPFVEAGYKR